MTKNTKGNRSKMVLHEDVMCDEKCENCYLYEKLSDNDGICHLPEDLAEQDLHEWLVKQMI